MNTCYTYFAINGEFDPNEITRLLGLQPFKSYKKGERRAHGSGTYTCSTWSFGKCDEYDVNVNVQIRKTIAPLLDKLETLKYIKDNFAVNFYIEVVPKIYGSEPTPILGLELDIIDFCHITRTELDIDMYVFE